MDVNNDASHSTGLRKCALISSTNSTATTSNSLNRESIIEDAYSLPETTMDLLNELQTLIHSKSKKIFALPLLVRNRGDELINKLKTSLLPSKPQLRTSDAVAQTDEAGIPHCTRSYADVIRQQQTKKHTLLLYPTASLLNSTTYGHSSNPVEDILRNQINPTKDKIHIVNHRKLRNNGLAIDCENQMDIAKLIHKIDHNETLKDNLNHVQPKPRLPRCILYNIPPDTTADEIKEAIEISTNTLNQDIKFPFKLKGKYDNNHWVVELPLTTFHLLKKRGKLPINWTICRIKEFFNLRRCHRCQYYGHTQSTCRANRQYCAHCSEDHSTRNCTSSSRVCINCMESNEKKGTSFFTNHSTTDINCPCYKSAVESYKKTVNY